MTPDPAGDISAPEVSPPDPVVQNREPQVSPLDAAVDSRDPSVRPARPVDVWGIKALVDAYAGPILLGKTLANLFEDVREFWVAEIDGRIVGCGALHVLWEDLAEIRTVATDPALRNHGIGHAVCGAIIAHAREMGLRRLFCLTFEVRFFETLGFKPIGEIVLDETAQQELLASYDAGVAEFLDLPYVKPNTLGNTRMLLQL